MLPSRGLENAACIVPQASIVFVPSRQAPCIPSAHSTFGDIEQRGSDQRNQQQLHLKTNTRTLYRTDAMGGKTANKEAYFDKLETLLKEYKSIFIVTVDNVSSQQMHEIRHSMRGQSVVLMGKNTMVR